MDPDCISWSSPLPNKNKNTIVFSYTCFRLFIFLLGELFKVALFFYIKFCCFFYKNLSARGCRRAIEKF